MKKKYLCLLFFVTISLLLLSGCGSSSDISEGTAMEPTKYETVNNLNGVTMSVKEGSVSSTGLTVIFENNSKKQCIYGAYFLLEKKIGGIWYEVPDTLDGNYGFDDIGYDLNSSDVTEWKVDWEWLYGKLDSGEYRIVKDVLDFRKPGDFDHFINPNKCYNIRTMNFRRGK